MHDTPPTATSPRSAQRSRRVWQLRLLALGLATGLTFLAVEVGLRVARLEYGHSPTADHLVFHHWNPTNYSALSESLSGEYGGFRVEFNADGFAMSQPLPPKSEPAMLFLGDSFTLARQVPEPERFASLVAAHFQMHALNFGNSSACPVLSRLELEFFADRVAPRAVIYQLYANDVKDEQEMRKLAVRDDAGRIVAVPGNQQSWAIEIARRSYVARLVRQAYLQWSFNREQQRRGASAKKVDPWSPLHSKPLSDWYSPEELSEVEESIAQLAEFCRARGWPLFFCVIPDRGALKEGLPDHYADYFKQFAAGQKIAYIDLAEAFAPYAGSRAKELYFAHDIHLTAAGHRVVAEAIERALEADRTWQTAPTPGDATAEGAARGGI